MKTTLLAIATAAAVLTAAPLLAGTAKADPVPRLMSMYASAAGTARESWSGHHAVIATVSWSPTDGPIAVPSPCGNGVTARGSRAPSGNAAEGGLMRT